MSPRRTTPKTCLHPACNNNPTLCPGRMVCAPVSHPAFDTVQLAILVLLLLDYVARMGLVGFVRPRYEQVATISLCLFVSLTL